MRVVVPLAGPDFILRGGKLKANIKFDGKPLLRRILTSRPWAKTVASHDYSFVLFDASETRSFATDLLLDWYPDAKLTFISSYTRGAALSALAGMATGEDMDAHIIVDLADILYESNLDPKLVFQSNADCGAIGLTFHSDNPAYSYLSLDTSGCFENASEKRVISKNASAGTYIFRNLATYLRALAHNLENEHSQTFQNLFYVCPLFNGIKDIGSSVLLEPVKNVIDVKVDAKR
jgi:hypothetical protein